MREATVQSMSTEALLGEFVELMRWFRETGGIRGFHAKAARMDLVSSELDRRAGAAREDVA